MKEIISLYRQYTGKSPDFTEEIRKSVSNRRYFRLSRNHETVIGTYSPDVRETKAFVSFSNHFRSLNFPVPEILAVSDDLRFYLQSDLGDDQLFTLVSERPGKDLGSGLIAYYKQAVMQLVRLQVKGGYDLDYSVCVPRPSFDRQSVLWDLNHFKYYFLKPSGLPFDEQLLEEGFLALADRVTGTEPKGFMFRDFQSRNIMIKNGEVCFIDYQGGRRGPLFYDLASLVWEARTALTAEDRETIIQDYYNALSALIPLDESLFREDLYVVSLVRILQALGAFGLRGKMEKKAVFLQSIPTGLEYLGEVLKMTGEQGITPYLKALLQELAATAGTHPKPPAPFDGLTVTIYSFSYRKPLPDDLTGNGGGFVYDCRLLSNPGRCEGLSALTGMDPDVIRFMEEDPGVGPFLDLVKNQLEMAFKSYRERGYTNLMVSFGCTGGRHRSVYCAREIADWCRTIPGLRIREIHREMGLEY